MATSSILAPLENSTRQRSRVGYRQKEKGNRWLNSIIDTIDMNLSKLQKTGKGRKLACSIPTDHKESDTT